MRLLRASSLAAFVTFGRAIDQPTGGAPEESITGAGALFVVDRGGDSIVRFDAATGAFRDVFAAGRAAEVDRPSSVRL